MDEYGLINALTRDEDVPHSRRQIKKSVAIMFEEITSALERGQRVDLDGIGTLSTRTIGARWGDDPATGQSVMLPATAYPAWHPDRKLVARLKASTATGTTMAKRANPRPLFRLITRLMSRPSLPGPYPH